jgi:hypothetical protein
MRYPGQQSNEDFPENKHMTGATNMLARTTQDEKTTVKSRKLRIFYILGGIGIILLIVGLTSLMIS